jgi:hypothetical protein
MQWRSMMMAPLLLMLIACGGSSADAATPNQVHRAWIQAVQANDRERARALLVAESQPYLDAGLGELQSEMQGAALGPLTAAIDVQPPVAQGAGQIGISVWPFRKRTVCYRTRMAETPDGWKVTEFSRTACP